VAGGKENLYIVSTPIGNLEDITLRALKTLRHVHIIAAEDTRHTGILLRKYHIHTPQTSYHDHNKEEKAEVLIDKMKQGKDVALVSDAGTPGISDPGYYLIKRAIEEGIKIIPIPGPTAMIAAISISGLPTDAFVFEGFLPARKGARQKRLRTLRDERRTIILFEAPHRLKESLEDILNIMGDRRIVITRELTKIHEEVLRGRISEIKEMLKNRSLKGEITIIIEGKRDDDEEEERLKEKNVEEHLRSLLNKGMSVKDAVREVSRTLGVQRKMVYRKALAIKKM